MGEWDRMRNVGKRKWEGVLGKFEHQKIDKSVHVDEREKGREATIFIMRGGNFLYIYKYVS